MFSVFLCCRDMLVDTGDVCAGGVWRMSENHKSLILQMQIGYKWILFQDSNLIDCQVKGVQAHAHRNEMKGVQVRTWVFHACKDGYIGLSKLCFTQWFIALNSMRSCCSSSFWAWLAWQHISCLGDSMENVGLVQPYTSKATGGEGMTWQDQMDPSGS